MVQIIGPEGVSEICPSPCWHERRKIHQSLILRGSLMAPPFFVGRTLALRILTAITFVGRDDERFLGAVLNLRIGLSVLGALR